MSTAKQVSADLTALSNDITGKVYKVVGRYGLMLQADVKRRASRARTLPSVAGKPPRLQTGDYNRSIGMRPTRIGTTAVASVGTNAEQGARLEFGYSGANGSTWPHPHFGPAMDRVEPLFLAGLTKAMGPDSVEVNNAD